MAVLILKNVSSEGPGTIEHYLAHRSIAFSVVDLHAGELIMSTSRYDTLVMMGGPMSVNDEAEYPYLKREFELTRKFIRGGKRVFGVCLGSQIMAKALGGKVYKGPAQEIGWLDIVLTGEALRDPAVRSLSMHPDTGHANRTVTVFQWHGETFTLPRGAVRLASSDLYPNQAFRYGQRAYAFQFHIEVTKQMVFEWLKNEPVDQAALKRATEELYDIYNRRAFAFYDAFFRN
ncbi:MAG TPA: type 1 glutamine amidotransferase [Dissulfurispiraceae bacterium]|nr:type 1 glutamine amidotransferase [Dissulfurispiraceae bacterium]